MKTKINFKRVLKWFLDASLKAMVILGLGLGAFYVYGQITFPGVDPYTVTGVVGQFVGVTTETYDGTPAGYTAVNQLCSEGAGALLGSHICTSMELINSYNVGNAAIIAQAGNAWFNNGPPAHDATLVNDCNGWTSVAATQYGSIWRFGEDRALIMLCNESLPFACCR